MQATIILFASPVFFALITVEMIVAWRRQRHTYRLNDAINSLSLGVMSQISAVFFKVLSIGIYAWVLKHFALLTLPSDAWWVWIAGLFAYDFLYYWLHRMGHHVNVLWAAHVVHHQSEDYNLTTALRQTSTGSLLGWIFYIPLAILGLPVEVFVVIALIDLLYQFWIHTQQIGKLGWFDRVFVSPSNHRVHHAVNDLYLDKNFGGILILWDRLFGTYADELDEHPVVYGTRKPLQSWNPFWANVEVYHAVAMDALRIRRWRDKLKIWFMPPGWLPEDLASKRPASPFQLHHPLYNPALSTGLLWYCLAQFIVTLNISTHFLFVEPTASSTAIIAYALWLVAGFWIVGGLLEQNKKFIFLESLRLLVTACAVVVNPVWFGTVRLPLWGQVGIIGACLASLFVLGMLVKNRDDSVFNNTNRG